MTQECKKYKVKVIYPGMNSYEYEYVNVKAFEQSNYGYYYFTLDDGKRLFFPIGLTLITEIPTETT